MHLQSIRRCPELRACLASSAPRDHIQGRYYYYHPVLQRRKQRQREAKKLAQGHVESHAPNRGAHHSCGMSLDARGSSGTGVKVKMTEVGGRLHLKGSKSEWSLFPLKFTTSLILQTRGPLMLHFASMPV